ncbi:twin-arginine translocase TatA/TatE family subunit [Pseudomonas sp. HR96]|uniref:twin-arginine translocase TatA/TatE family subunit n=1 Tax=Pseudomonas sp. HR96 TaxID=1027966 RepID=UPI002A762361|nr:twin-arginine translocase TatA/TatE family subunit [Pseudomonas sp. HR96]WPO99626.1 twin-arginine translocase TatA/TatE family subunit [Pseudomonas sp. HR96]
MGIFDWKHWIVILVVVVLIFGTKKLKNLGTDVGESIKGFRKAMNDDDKPAEPPVQPVHPQATSPINEPRPVSEPHTIDGQHHKVEEPIRKD